MNSKGLLVVVVAAACCVVTAVAGQRGAGAAPAALLEQGNGGITGTIIRIGFGSPIHGATVTIVRIDGAAGDVIAANNPGGVISPNVRGAADRGGLQARGAAQNTWTVQTDANGTYSVGGLVSGQYRVRASAPGFIAQSHGQQAFDTLGTPVTVAGNGSLTVDFQLLAAGGIEGTVINEDGLPMADSRIQLFAASYGGGSLRLVPSQSVETNGIGEYRIPSVEPGEYYVAASLPPAIAMLSPETAAPQRALARGAARAMGARASAPVDSSIGAPPTRAYPPTFYPSGDVTQAAPITIPPGGEVRGVNVALRPVTLGSIRGSLVAPVAVQRTPSASPPVSTPSTGPGRGPGVDGAARGPRGLRGQSPVPTGAGARQTAPRGGGDGPAVQGPGGARSAANPGAVARGAGAVRGAPARGVPAASTNPVAGVTIQLIPVGIGTSGGAAAAGRGAAAPVGPARGGTARGPVGRGGISGGTEVARATSSADGGFQFENVFPGSYVLFASAAGNALTAYSRLDVSYGSIDNYTLSLRQSVPAPAQIYWVGEPPQAFRPESIEVSLTPVDAVPVNVVTARVKADGTLKFDDVAPGRYRLAVAASGGAYVETALFNGADTLSDSLQIDDDKGSIQLWIGFTSARIDAIVEHAGDPFPNARVVLAPATRTRTDLFRVGTADKNGRVSFANVPPGSYKLFAWESLSRTNAYQNPRFLEPFESQGRPVSVGKTGASFEGHLEVLPAVP